MRKFLIWLAVIALIAVVIWSVLAGKKQEEDKAEAERKAKQQQDRKDKLEEMEEASKEGAGYGAAAAARGDYVQGSTVGKGGSGAKYGGDGTPKPYTI
jgi:FtsZ-interacting cell division protein ZipA